jgi:HK97 family phage major capsid protein
MVPWEVEIERRALDTSSGAGGITTKLGPIIDLLRSHAYVTLLGADVVADARGAKFGLPQRGATAQVSWVGESAAPPAESHQQLATQVGFTPHTATAYTDMSHRASVSIPDSEAVVIDDLTRALGVEIDRVALAGTGGALPTGLLNIAGIPSVSFGANGGAPTWPTIVSMRTQVASASGDVGPTAWLWSPAAEGKLRTTDKSGANSGRYLWDDQQNTICGFPAFSTNNLPSNLVSGSSGPVCSAGVYGAFSALTLVFWGPLTLLVNPYLFSINGCVRISAFADIDVAPRWPGAFCITNSMTTT